MIPAYFSNFSFTIKNLTSEQYMNDVLGLKSHAFSLYAVSLNYNKISEVKILKQ